MLVLRTREWQGKWECVTGENEKEKKEGKVQYRCKSGNGEGDKSCKKRERLCVREFG